MCRKCFQMNRRAFTQGVISAASAALLGSVPGQSFADVAQFSVPGELTPSFEPSRWVTAIDRNALEPYRHDSINYIAYHHEGFAEENLEWFEQRKLSRSDDEPIERTYNIHKDHVEKGYGMIAYNYVVAPDGEIVRARPLNFAPATGSTDPRTGKIANFSDHFAVVALADFDFERVADRKNQVFSMIKIMSLAQRTFRVASKDIRPHKDHVAYGGEFGSTCPGRNLYAERDKIRAMTLALSVQSELSVRGCYSGSLDGLFGPASRSSLAAFSEKNRSLGSLALNDDALWALLDVQKNSCG